MVNRRQFIDTCAAGAALSLAGPVPSSFAQLGEKKSRHPPEQTLVVLFLQGGNDGLNTLIPAKDPRYQKCRRECRISAADALGIGDGLFLHPSLRGLADVWENDRLAIVQAAGYPNHNRSHFVSTAVWQSGNIAAQPEEGHGWLGFGLDQQQREMDAPIACSVGAVDTPHVLRGRYTRTAAPLDLRPSEAREVLRLLKRDLVSDAAAADLVGARRRDALDSVNQLLSSRRSTEGQFPGTELGRQFEKISWMIDSGSKSRVFFLKHAGYDTHAGQLPAHAALLRDLGFAVLAFDRWAQASGNGKRVTTMIFSEFGRRLEDNASGGTDHGKGGPVFLLGESVRPGLHGKTPNLEDADEGDVRVTTDFRSIYKAIQHRLGEFDDSFEERIQPLSLFRGSGR